MTVLVTGANGFIGVSLCERLWEEAYTVRSAIRLANACREDANVIGIGDITIRTDWSFALRDVRQVVHLAARIKEEHGKNSDELVEFRRVNTEGTANLARQAAAAGVTRFVYLSSIKVNGEATINGSPFTLRETPMPSTPYGISKFEAELCLRQIAIETGMEVVIIRPPLVYGSGMKGNLKSMMRWVSHGIPLPLAAATKNRRSLVAVDNLIDLIVTCLNHPAAANKTFLVSDGEDLSTTELLQRLGFSMKKSVHLLAVPLVLLRFFSKLFGKSNISSRLLDSLQVDISETCETLGWSPPVCVNEGLKRASQGLCE